MNARARVSGRSVLPAVLVVVGVEPPVGRVGTWSLAHCWALRNHTPLARTGRAGVGGPLGSAEPATWSLLEGPWWAGVLSSG